VTVTVFAFGIADDKITRIWIIRNPDKLRPLDVSPARRCAQRGPG
jgi:RNA polymerase sigma-70 factor (ECF subfamily)